MNNNLRVTFKNFFSVAGAGLVARLLNTLLVIYIARTFGPSAFGQVAFALAFSSYFNVLSDFGLSILGVREIARFKEKTSQYVTNVLLLRIFISAVLLLIVGSILLVIPLPFRIKWITFLFSLVIVPQTFNLSYVFSAYQRMEFVALTRSVSQIGYVAFAFVAILIFKDIIVIPIVQLAAFFVGAVLSIILVKKVLSFVWGRLDINVIKRLIRDSWPFVIGAFMVQVYFNSDLVMLQFLEGERSVGIYSSAYKVVFFLISISLLFNSAAFPTIVDVFHHQKNKFRDTLFKYFRIIMIFIAPISFGAFATSGALIGFLFGKEYLAAVLPFSILIFVPVVSYLNNLLNSTVIATGWQKYSMYALTSGAVVNIVLNFALIPRFSLTGAAIATISAEVVVFILLFLYFNKLVFRISLIEMRVLFKPLLAAVIMAILLLIIRLPLSAEIILGVAIYSTILLAIGGVSLADYKYIASMFRKRKAQ